MMCWEGGCGVVLWGKAREARGEALLAAGEDTH